MLMVYVIYYKYRRIWIWKGEQELCWEKLWCLSPYEIAFLFERIVYLILCIEKEFPV